MPDNANWVVAGRDLIRVTGVIASWLISGSALLWCFTMAHADDRFGDADHERAYRNRQSGVSEPLSKVLKKTRKIGRVGGIRMKRNGYRVKVLRPDGRVDSIDVRDIDPGSSRSMHGVDHGRPAGRGKRR